ncbi:MAG: OmpA family protein [Polyangia bacterium]|jgi:outer membrane protein OmpA-like peptidoglycan-associated protein|nr:OmpA family protein [Polyangia bacterium]
MIMRMGPPLAALLGILLAGSGCGSPLEGKADGIRRIIKQAWTNGAYKCQPRHLTLAERNLRFGVDRLNQGFYHEGKKFLGYSEDHAQKAFDGSPPERCAQRVAIAPPPPPVARRAVVKVLDTDGDGIPDDKDKCPNDPEDKDGFEDEDGCPDLDNDQDGIADKVDNCPATDKDKANNFKDTKEDVDSFEDDDGCPDPDNDKDGIADVIDKCPNDPEDVDGFEDDDGCPDPDNDKDGICDNNETIQKNLAKYEKICKGSDKCPNEPETFNGFEDEDGCPDKKLLVRVTKTKIELTQKVYFDYNKAVIQSRSYQLLRDVATVLKDRPSMKVRIEGHTDSRGGRAYNKRLSQRRAASVRQFLIGEGVSPDRMESVGYGMEREIASNKTEAGREKNRRVEFFITSQ